MDKDQLALRLLATFQGELPEHIEALNENLLALEKDPAGAQAGARIKSLFRAAHSLKGAARAVSLKPIEQMCHHLEEALRAVQSSSLALDETTFALLFGAADALEDARRRLSAGQDLSGGPLDDVAQRLAATSSRPASAQPLGLGAQRPLWSRRSGAVPQRAPVAEPPVSPAPSAPLPPPSLTPPPASEAVVRVAAPKLDLLLARSGELMIAQRRLERAEEGVAAVGEALAEIHREWRERRKKARPPAVPEQGRAVNPLRALETKFAAARADLERMGGALREDRRSVARAVSLMDEAVRRVRLLPFSEACQTLDRAARDLARSKGKEVEVAVEGASIEIDRSILDGLRDPLLALVRNAVDHGIELPEARRAAGKPERGRVAISAALRGARVEISVADDGGGVDFDAVRERALERGLPVPSDDAGCAALLFEPGFSTAEAVTEISGRGVGLDIAKTRAEALHGSVEIASVRGSGTRVTFTLPSTVTTARALLVAAGGETFAIPGTGVVRLFRLEPGEIRSVGGREVVAGGDGPPIPIFALSRILGLRNGLRPARRISAVVVGAQTRVALAVDELIAEREILMKALSPRLGQVRHATGATILETGRIALILNVAELVRAALERRDEPSLSAGQVTPQARRRILLADDSVTTRSLERSILEAAGYEVLTAVDGEQAFQLLQERGADLLVSDVDMPRMDGISLCKAVRSSKRFRDLPVVLVTGLDSEQDRGRGAGAGADAYLVKSAFDQRDLLSSIATLLGGGG